MLFLQDLSTCDSVITCNLHLCGVLVDFKGGRGGYFPDTIALKMCQPETGEKELNFAPPPNSLLVFLLLFFLYFFFFFVFRFINLRQERRNSILLPQAARSPTSPDFSSPSGFSPTCIFKDDIFDLDQDEPT